MNEIEEQLDYAVDCAMSGDYEDAIRELVAAVKKALRKQPSQESV